jgi:hypothetical protein
VKKNFWRVAREPTQMTKWALKKKTFEDEEDWE